MMEQETSNNLEDSNVKREMLEDEQTNKVNPVSIHPEVRKKDIMEVEHCTKPEILDPCVINHSSESKGNHESVSKDKWMGKQKMEQVMGSSDEETSGTPEVSTIYF